MVKWLRSEIARWREVKRKLGKRVPLLPLYRINMSVEQAVYLAAYPDEPDARQMRERLALGDWIDFKQALKDKLLLRNRR